jgi:hypothetical protein
MWPEAVENLPASRPVTDATFGQWKDLALVNDVRPSPVQGHDVPDDVPPATSGR